MKTLLAAAAALGAMAIAVPAHADPRDGGYNPAYTSGREAPISDSYRGEYRGGYAPSAYSRDAASRVGERIDRGFQSGRLTTREAERLNWQLNDLRQRARLYWRTDGIDWREQRDLDARYVRLRDAVRYQMHDDDRRGDDGYRGPPPRY